MKPLYFFAIIASIMLVGCNAKPSADSASGKSKAAPMTIAEEGQKYAEEMLASDTAFHRTDSGLIIKIERAGTGKPYTTDDIASVAYTGKHVDGEVFDTSRGEHVKFPVSRVVPGFAQALMMMGRGAKAIAIIPGELAYGPSGVPQGGIRPNETLVFEIETFDE